MPPAVWNRDVWLHGETLSPLVQALPQAVKTLDRRVMITRNPRPRICSGAVCCPPVEMSPFSDCPILARILIDRNVPLDRGGWCSPVVHAFGGGSGGQREATGGRGSSRYERKQRNIQKTKERL